MVRHISRETYSELWKKLPWKKFQRNLFRLQCRVWKAQRRGDLRTVRNLQKLILKSASARFLAIRQVTQLNQGKKTAGVDGKKSLTFKQRLELAESLKEWGNWKHKELRVIPIPKKDGTRRILKIPCLDDRAWQKLLHYALDPVYEADAHARSYGFRPGRSAHDAQKLIFLNLNSQGRKSQKRILELDIEKCFDRIDHRFLMNQVILPQKAKLGLWKCLKRGTQPEFPEQGTPQGGCISPTLANIVLNGIENIHASVRYADDLVVFLKPEDKEEGILEKIREFLAQRGLKLKEAKTKIVRATDGFDFLGWHLVIHKNGKFHSYPSEENYRDFLQKVKAVVNNSQLSVKKKVKKLATTVRGWRNYHRYCNMSRHHLWHIAHRTWKVFNKGAKQNRYTTTKLIQKAFPNVSWKENHHINVKGNIAFLGLMRYSSSNEQTSYEYLVD